MFFWAAQSSLFKDNNYPNNWAFILLLSIFKVTKFKNFGSKKKKLMSTKFCKQHLKISKNCWSRRYLFPKALCCLDYSFLSTKILIYINKSGVMRKFCQRQLQCTWVLLLLFFFVLSGKSRSLQSQSPRALECRRNTNVFLSNSSCQCVWHTLYPATPPQVSRVGSC